MFFFELRHGQFLFVFLRLHRYDLITELGNNHDFTYTDLPTHCITTNVQRLVLVRCTYHNNMWKKAIVKKMEIPTSIEN